MRDLHIDRPLSVSAVVDGLHLGADRLSPDRLATLVEEIAGHEALWRPIVRHDFAHRWYRRLHWSDAVEVWLLGWQPGQDTRFHDHGGSSGAFVVTEGELVEEHGRLRPWTGTRHRTHGRHRPCAFGPAHTHNLGNGGLEGATSIHAYSPPLTTMTYYDLSQGTPVAYQTLRTAGPEPGIDLSRATGGGGWAAPAPV